MADDFSSLVAAGTTKANPLGAMAEGANQGVNWAQNQAKLDLAKQSHELDTQRLQQQKAEYTSKLGEQAYSDFNSWALMPEGSKLKKVKAAMWKNNYAINSHVFTEDTVDQMTAMTADPEIQKEIKKLQDALGTLGTDSPEAYKQITASMTFLDGMEKGISFFKDQNSHLLQVKSAMAMKQASLNMQNKRLASTEIRSGQAQYAAAQKPVEIALTAVLRAKNLLDKGESGDPFKLTQQLLSTISSEQRKVELGIATSAEGTRERGIYTSLGGTLGNIIQKLSGVTKQTASKDFIKQIRGELNEMGVSYHQQHDNTVATLLGGATPSQKSAIVGSANAYIKGKLGKGGFKSWGGGGYEGSSSGQTQTQSESTPQDDQATIMLISDFKKMLGETKTPAGKAALLKEARAAFPGRDETFFSNNGLK